MRVLKAINNNVVSCVDDSGRELIAMGKGLGFRSRAGDVLRPEDAEKVFRMESDEEFSRFKDVLSSFPCAFWSFAPGLSTMRTMCWAASSVSPFT